MDSREDSLSRIQALRARFRDQAHDLGDVNEAATRLLLVDEVLKALGWDPSEFDPELPTASGGYSDYLLRADGQPRLVVEAKKRGYTFKSPLKAHRRTSYRLKYMKSAFGKSFNDVLEQATRYAHDHRVPYAAITNGAEWIIAQVIPSAYNEIDELHCYYVANILNEASDLDLLWELMSRPAVVSGSMEESFSQINSFEADFCHYPRERTGELSWSRLGASEHELQTFYRSFFDEIVDPARRNMLEHCYVTNTRLDQYEGQLKRVLKDTSPAYVDGAQEITPGDRRQVLPENFGDQRGRVVLVVGSVGCGKSTFVNKVLVEARRDTSSPICVLLDLIDDIGNAGNHVQERLWKRVYDVWRRQSPLHMHSKWLRQIFHAELEELRHGPREPVFRADPSQLLEAEAQLLEELSRDPEAYLMRSWRGLHQQHRGVVLFLDNVDRASESFQQQVYAFAHRIARTTGATVLVPLREMTYYKGKDGGFLDVRSSDVVFHLQTPDLVQVIAKRIRYIEGHLTEDHRHRRWRSASVAGGRRLTDVFVEQARALKKSLLEGSDSSENVKLLAAIAWHDVRRFLYLVRLVHQALEDEGDEWREDQIVAALMTFRGDGAGAIPNRVRLFWGDGHDGSGTRLRCGVFARAWSVVEGGLRPSYLAA